MQKIALETSTRQCSLALFHGHELVKQLKLDDEQPASVHILAKLKQLLQSNSTPEPVSGLLISIGPGSFTGLRMGVTVAKTLAYYHQSPVIPVSTHRVIAQQAIVQNNDISDVVSVIDAQRAQWFVQRFQLDATGDLNPVGDAQVVDPKLFVDSLKTETMLTGPALFRYADKLDFPDNIQLSNDDCWQPLAQTMGRWTEKQDWCMSPFEVVPVYGRKSAAEEKWEAKSVSRQK